MLKQAQGLPIFPGLLSALTAYPKGRTLSLLKQLAFSLSLVCLVLLMLSNKHIRWHQVSLRLNPREVVFKKCIMNIHVYVCIYMYMLHVHSGSAEAQTLCMPGKYCTSELHSQLKETVLMANNQCLFV